MSQKTNKIIVVISVVILIALIVIILLIGKKNSNIFQKRLLLSTPYEYYKKCSSYLGQPQILKNGIAVIKNRIENVFSNHSIIRQKNKGYMLVTANVAYPEDGKVKEKLLQKLEDKLADVVAKKGE